MVHAPETQNSSAMQCVPLEHVQPFPPGLTQMQRLLALQSKPLSIEAQSAFVAHSTHVRVAGSQTGASPLHGMSSASSHIPHPPVLAHTVPLGLPAHSPSPLHPRHVAVVASHTGVVPLHPS